MKLRNFKKLLIIGLAQIILLSSAHANSTISPEKLALMDDLIDAAGEVERMEISVYQYLVSVGGIVIHAVAQQGVNRLEDGGTQADNDEVYLQQMENLDRLHHEVKARVDFADVTRQVMYPLYDKFYTKDDLRAMVDLAQSPIEGMKNWESTSTAKKYQANRKKFKKLYGWKIIEIMDPIVIELLEELDLGGIYPTYEKDKPAKIVRHLMK